MTRAKKRQVCFRIEESIVEEMENIREKTGVPVSTQIELRLKGFTIISTPEKGNPEEILHLFTSLEKDEELANNIDIAAERLRKELKFH
ncbi:MAG: ribbon-helix-helix domain-containing protein [Chloroflexi bacterium]|nr:ribbon-helix-helix domain-containing protein [Chloroflexota bacterium]